MSVPIGVGVSIGPHDDEPHELADLMDSAAGPATEDVLVAGRAAWLIDVLNGAGVVLGPADREAVGLIAAQRPSATQIVAGWVARSTHPLQGLHRYGRPSSETRR